MYHSAPVICIIIIQNIVIIIWFLRLFIQF